MSLPLVRAATDRDAQAIRELLERAGLPTADLDAARPEFVVACDEGTKVIGAGALQHFGVVALLRSVAVAPGRRNAGIGRVLVRELEELAVRRGVAELVLLTQTAKEFFERQGYRVIERREVNGAVLESDEFRSLCPASATCMSKELR